MVDNGVEPDAAAHDSVLDCWSCPLGTYQLDNGLNATIHAYETSCVACEKGTAASQSGSAACDICPPGFYADKIGAVKCTKCAAGETTGG